MFNIIETTHDLSGKVRVRVDLVGESVFFKFDQVPTQEQVDWETVAFLSARENAVTDSE